MKKLLISAGIILALCLSSFRSSAMTVPATCDFYYDITDVNPPPGTITYEAYLEVVTLYPTDTRSSNFTPTIGSVTYLSIPVNGVGYDSPPSISADYYDMILHVFHLLMVSFDKEVTGSSYGAMSHFQSVYTLTANNEIDTGF